MPEPAPESPLDRIDRDPDAQEALRVLRARLAEWERAGFSREACIHAIKAAMSLPTNTRSRYA